MGVTVGALGVAGVARGCAGLYKWTKELAMDTC